MKRVSLLCAIAAASAAIMIPSAKADQFTITFNGGPVGFSGTGVFEASAAGNGVYDITAVDSGSVTDPTFGTSAIVSLDSTFGGPDNQLSYPSTPYLDGSGLSFDLANNVSINLFSIDDVDGALESNVNGNIAELVTLTVVPTPEPSSFVLLGSAALLGMGNMLRRRRSIA